MGRSLRCNKTMSKLMKDFFFKNQKYRRFNGHHTVQTFQLLKMLKDVYYNGSSFKNKGELWFKLQETVINFNSSKASTIQNMKKNIVKRYLDVLVKNGVN